MNTEKCPHCGAEKVEKNVEYTYFACGSTEWYWPGHARYLFERGDDCYERQIAALKAEVEIEKGKVIGLETGKYGVQHLGMRILELQSELDKRKWQPIETATIEEVARFKACIREILQVVKVHAAKAESDPTGEHLGCSELDWSGCVDHLAIAANSLTEPPKEDLPPLPVEAVKANSQHPPKLKKSINEPPKEEQ